MILPNGRTQEYRIFRVCERFGIPPRDFYEYSQDEQVELVAYEGIREDEEYNEALAKAKHGSGRV